MSGETIPVIHAPHYKTMNLLDEVNGIKRYVISPCAINPMVYVETFFPAANLAIWMWLNQFTQISTMRASLGKPPIDVFRELIRGLNPMRGKGRGRRGCGMAMSGSPGSYVAPKYQSTGVDKVTRALFQIDRRLFAALFWFSVVETVTRGLYSWMSLAHKVQGCVPDAVDGPFGGAQLENSYFHQATDGVAFLVGPHGWWDGNILTMEPGHIYGYMFAPGMISSLFGELTKFKVELRWRKIGQTSWDFKFAEQEIDLIARPNDHVAMIADYTSHSSVLGTIQVKCFMTSTIDPPRSDYWSLGTGGEAVAWRA